ncbi:hypothetical protein FQA39_LY19422 [Lamprigera yunnana]|nr:hypothetical protein FQA39_LY19422 [Lamprigera yunnana]
MSIICSTTGKSKKMPWDWWCVYWARGRILFKATCMNIVTVLRFDDRIMDRQLDAKASQMLKTAIGAIRHSSHRADTEEYVGKMVMSPGSVKRWHAFICRLGFLPWYSPNYALAQSAGLRCNRGVWSMTPWQTFDPRSDALTCHDDEAADLHLPILICQDGLRLFNGLITNIVINGLRG